MFDWVDRRNVLEARPFFDRPAFGLMDAYSVKKEQSGDRRWCSSLDTIRERFCDTSITYKGLSLGSHPSRLRLQYEHLTKSSLSRVGQ